MNHDSAGKARLGLGLAFVAVLAVGVFLRLYRLGELPFGFHPDEAHNLLDAVRINQGWRPLYLTNNNGREALLSYLIAGSVGLFGPSVWSVRLVTALGGALVIPAEYLLVQSLPLPRPRLTALASAALIAVTFWPVAQARYALRSNLVPVWVALVIWAWWGTIRSFQRTEDGGRAFGRRQALWIGATAIFLAGLIHTHPNGRLIPLILGLSALWLVLRERRPWPLLAGAAVVASTVVLVSPLIYYFATHPDMLNYRVNQVSVFNSAVNQGDLLGTLAGNTWKLMLNPIVRGDSEWYYNLSGRPVFVGLDAMFFVFGFLLLLRDGIGRRGRVAQDAAVLLLMALLVTHASSWLSGKAPNFSRLTGTWPVLFLLTAWGLERTAWWLSGLLRRITPAGRTDTTRGAASGWWLIAAALGLSLALNMSDYLRYVRKPEVYQVFHGAEVERAAQIADLVAQGPTYVSPALWQESVVRALTAAHPPGVVDPRAGLVRPAAQGQDIRYLLDPVEVEDAAQIARQWPALQRRDFVDHRGQPSLVAFTLPAAVWPPTDTDAANRFGDTITVHGVQAAPVSVHPGGTVTDTLEFQALAPMDVDLHFFVHLVTPDGDTIGQFDGPPLDGSYPTTSWLPGDRILQRVVLTVDDDAPTGPATLQTGWYDWRTQQRLPLADDADGALDVGTVEVVR